MKRILEVKKQIGKLSKNAKNPFFKSQYLDLNDLLTEVEPLLWGQGLVLMQPIEMNEVSSIIYDSENGSVIAKSSLTLPDISDPQKLGSCITYFRRYTLKSLLSISEKDDDGNEASGKKVDSVKKQIPNDRFEKALEAISKGSYTYEKIENQFDLTDAQKAAIKLHKKDGEFEN